MQNARSRVGDRRSRKREIEFLRLACGCLSKLDFSGGRGISGYCSVFETMESRELYLKRHVLLVLLLPMLPHTAASRPAEVPAHTTTNKFGG